jgi:hypothetical protein
LGLIKLEIDYRLHFDRSRQDAGEPSEELLSICLDFYNFRKYL